MSRKIPFTTGERVSAGIALTIGLMGVINWATWHWTVFGLSQKQMLILSALPMMIVIAIVSPEDRLSKVRDE